MKLAVMQPYFLPYIGYWQAISAVDKYILYGNVSFMKKGWINRNRIVNLDGSEYLFTVPLVKQSSFKNIIDTEIDNSQQWSRKLLLLILNCYRRAAFYDEVYPVLQDLLSGQYRFIFDLNCRTITELASRMGLGTRIDCDNSRFDDMEKVLENIESDYSPLPYLEKTRPEKKVARVLELCRREGSDCYVNAIGGQELYSKEEFAGYGIDLRFIKTRDIEYRQCTKNVPFVPNLSIVDVLMNNGFVGTRELLKQYDLI